MSVVILGGNECMERRYKELCGAYQCQAKVLTKPSGGLKNKLGRPDLIGLFHQYHVPQAGAGRPQ